MSDPSFKRSCQLDTRISEEQEMTIRLDLHVLWISKCLLLGTSLPLSKAYNSRGDAVQKNIDHFYSAKLLDVPLTYVFSFPFQQHIIALNVQCHHSRQNTIFHALFIKTRLLHGFENWLYKQSLPLRNTQFMTQPDISSMTARLSIISTANVDEQEEVMRRFPRFFGIPAKSESVSDESSGSLCKLGHADHYACSKV